MSELTAMETLYDAVQGDDLPLPPALAAIYGRLRFPPHAGRAYTIANFVTTLDGVISLNVPGKSSGGPISGFNKHDRMVMGLLRAVADVVIVGAGTLRDGGKRPVTAEYIYPPLAHAYQQLRTAMGKAGPPLNVFVTASGDIDMSRPVLQSGEVPVLIVTGTEGNERLEAHELPPSVQIAVVPQTGALSARAILQAVRSARPSDIILVEAGPHLIGDFFAEQCLDELFLTLAPQIAGRPDGSERLGLVEGKEFAPEHPLWGTLNGIKQAGSLLFLRYAWGDERRPLPANA